MMRQADWLRALLVIVIWGVNFLPMKWGLEQLSPLLLSAMRFCVASLPFLLFVRKPANLTWGVLAAYGLVQGLGQFGMLFGGLALGMPAGMASVVLQAQAFISLLLGALFLHEQPRPWQWIGLVIASVGLGVIGAARGDGAGSMTLIGFALTLGSAAMWSLANLITRHAARQGPYEPLPFLVWSSIFPIAPLLVLSALVESPAFGSIPAQLQAAGWQAVGSVAYLALLSTLLGYGLWTKLLQRYTVGTVAPLSLLVPVIGIVSAMWAFDERPVLLHWLGAAGVLLGMAVNQWGGRWAKRA